MKRSDMTVLIYDTTQNIYTKIYPSESGGTAYIASQAIEGHEAYQYYKKAKENGGSVLTFTEGYEYSGITDRSNSESADSARYPFGNLADNSLDLELSELQSVICAEITTVASNEYLILIEAVVTPVSSTVTTLRLQLVIISLIMLALSAALAYFMSRVIAGPIVKINKNAKELAKQNYSVRFSGGGYREIKELSDTLNYATVELSKVEKLRQELIANVSHDLRTPLTMIIGYGEVIRDLPGENTPENIQIIIDEAAHLSTLVNDLLDLSKLQAGELTLEESVFSLTNSIKDIFTRYSRLVEQKGYRILFENDGAAEIKADPLKITQVLYNLMNNAVNYAGEDKTVIVRQKVENNIVKIEVEDHGKGIEEENLKFIWDRYYKVDKSHQSSVIGTGLGLSIVKNILDLHKARYGVQSQIGKGSVFWFSLPCVSFTKAPAPLTLCLSGSGAVTPQNPAESPEQP